MCSKGRKSFISTRLKQEGFNIPHNLYVTKINVVGGILGYKKKQHVLILIFCSYIPPAVRTRVKNGSYFTF
jgi:hypothetical protein